jgi:hypothetical protein
MRYAADRISGGAATTLGDTTPLVTSAMNELIQALERHGG